VLSWEENQKIAQLQEFNYCRIFWDKIDYVMKVAGNIFYYVDSPLDGTTKGED
jgi:hypothetical protein